MTWRYDDWVARPWDVRLGDSLDVLADMADASVDAVVTDPPYGFGISFNGVTWDYDVPCVELWRECLRVLKPGGHVLAFAGTRTQHRMACRIEDAGFEIRDMCAWVYSGMPKGANLVRHLPEWDGWSSQLKPSLEPVTMARKPMEGTLVDNVSAHGVGALHIGACRVGDEARFNIAAGNNRAGTAQNANFRKGLDPQATGRPPVGRWPANLIHDGSEEVLAAFPDAPGQQGGLTGDEPSCKAGGSAQHCYGVMDRRHASTPRVEEDKSAARFFYCAKVSKKERGISKHSTMKPVALMRYLVRLVAPRGALILDPFAGSGSTGVAAAAEGMRFIGVEREPESYVTAWCRVAAAYAQQRAVADDARTGQDAPPQETSP